MNLSSEKVLLQGPYPLNPVQVRTICSPLPKPGLRLSGLAASSARSVPLEGGRLPASPLAPHPGSLDQSPSARPTPSSFSALGCARFMPVSTSSPSSSSLAPLQILLPSPVGGWGSSFHTLFSTDPRDGVGLAWGFTASFKPLFFLSLQNRAHAPAAGIGCLYPSESSLTLPSGYPHSLDTCDLVKLPFHTAPSLTLPVPPAISTSSPFRLPLQAQSRASMNLYTWPPFPSLCLPCSSTSDSPLVLQPLLVSRLPSMGLCGLSCSYLEKPSIMAPAFTPCTAVEENHNPTPLSWSPGLLPQGALAVHRQFWTSSLANSFTCLSPEYVA